jgi:V/A-type H+/Na+-transporting ATPase subunit E
MKSTPSIENLDGLIRKIQEEGIGRAKLESEALVQSARQEAESIVNAAEAKAKAILSEAHAQSEKELTRGRQALKRAARDAVLGLRMTLTAVLDRLMAEACREELEGEKLGKFLEAVAVAWIQHHRNGGIELWLGEEDSRRLIETMLPRLQEALKTGIEIKIHPSVKAGFRLARRGDTLHYDFSDEALAEVLAASLHARFAALFEDWRNEEAPS